MENLDKRKVWQYLYNSPVDDVSWYITKDTEEEWFKNSRHVIGLLKWLNEKDALDFYDELDEDFLEKAKKDDQYYYQLLKNKLDYKVSMDEVDEEYCYFIGVRYPDYLLQVKKEHTYIQMVDILDCLYKEYNEDFNKFIKQYYLSHKEKIDLTEVSRLGCSTFFLTTMTLLLIYHSLSDVIQTWLQKITS